MLCFTLSRMANHGQSGEKERAADESENNAKQASGIWVRFVGTPGSGSFGRNQTPPQSLPKWVCFFESQLNATP